MNHFPIQTNQNTPKYYHGCRNNNFVKRLPKEYLLFSYFVHLFKIFMRHKCGFPKLGQIMYYIIILSCFCRSKTQYNLNFFCTSVFTKSC